MKTKRADKKVKEPIQRFFVDFISTFLSHYMHKFVWIVQKTAVFLFFIQCKNTHKSLDALVWPMLISKTYKILDKMLTDALDSQIKLYWGFSLLSWCCVDNKWMVVVVVVSGVRPVVLFLWTLLYISSDMLKVSIIRLYL